jgi:hypothetical protein
MSEQELLKDLSKLQSESQVLEIKIRIWKDERGKLDLIKRNEAVKAEISKIKKKLGLLNEKEQPVREEAPAKTERELLNDLSKLQSESQVLEIKIKIWKDEQGKNDLIRRNEAVKAKIEKLKRTLGLLYDELQAEEKEPAKTELESLKDIANLESQSQVLEIKIRIWKDEKGKKELIERNEALKEEIKKIRQKLDLRNDRKYGEETKSVIIRQLKEYISEININGHEMTANDLFEKIYNGLYFFVADKVSGSKAIASSPDPKNGDHPVDISALSDFLNHELEIITQIEAPTYVNLRRYFAEMKERIIKEFIGKKTIVKKES